MNMETRLIYKTKSVCPVCLREIYADIAARPDGIYMDKRCPEHGEFSTLVWADTAGGYLRWLSAGGIDTAALPQTEEEVERALAGASFADAAASLPATAALMTTSRCNMGCPVCFTRDTHEALHQPGLAECERLLRHYREAAGEDAAVEFCGGEPTVRGDLMELAWLARDLGFGLIQLNTNGIKLAESEQFCRELRESGVTTAYLGFDALHEEPYYAKYGKPMLETKLRAVENAAAAGLAVVLVCCVIPGENDGDLGAIVEYAKAHMPAVKGVYFQPISYFGVYPPDKIRRITIPDVIRRVAAQCPDVSERDFGPGAYDHAQCSFNAAYVMDKNGALRPLTRFAPRQAEADAVHRVRKNLALSWTPSGRRTLTIGGMAFQDAWNIDLLRVRRCSIQIIQKDGRLIPLCSKYLSSVRGEKLFPGIG